VDVVTLVCGLRSAGRPSELAKLLYTIAYAIAVAYSQAEGHILYHSWLVTSSTVQSRRKIAGSVYEANSELTTS